MFRSLRVVGQLFLIDGDCADCGRPRFCHLWGSLLLAGLTLVLVLVILIILLFLGLLCLSVSHTLGYFVGRFEPAFSDVWIAADGADGGLTKRRIAGVLG